MKAIQVDISDRTLAEAEVLSREFNMSVAELASDALQEYLRAVGRMRRTATEQDRQTYFDLLRRAPDVEPEEHDRLP